MNDIKQFFATTTGKIVSVVILLIIGISIGSATTSKPSDSVSNVTIPPSVPITNQVQTPTTSPAVTIIVPTQPVVKKVPTPTPVITPPLVVSTPVVVTPPPTPAPIPIPTKSWHTVYTISSSDTKQTPPFNIQGSQWRVTWSCSYISSQYPTTPTIHAYSVTGYSSDTVADPSTCPSTDTTYLYGGPGTYYFKISIYSATTITATVEDYY